MWHIWIVYTILDVSALYLKRLCHNHVCLNRKRHVIFWCVDRWRHLCVTITINDRYFHPNVSIVPMGCTQPFQTDFNTGSEIKRLSIGWTRCPLCVAADTGFYPNLTPQYHAWPSLRGTEVLCEEKSPHVKMREHYDATIWSSHIDVPIDTCTDLDKSSWTFFSGAYFTILCCTETHHNLTGYLTIPLVLIVWISQTYAVASCINAHFCDVAYTL